MRIFMGRAGIWAFLILMATFVAVLAASTPIFERLMGLRVHKRGEEYLPGPKQMVKPDDGFRAGEIPPEIEEDVEPSPAVDEADSAEGETEPASPPSPRPLAPMAKMRPKEKYLAAMTHLAHGYFDLAEDRWKGQRKFMGTLERMRERNYDLLGDPDWLLRVVYGARSFEPCMTDRKWQRAEEVTELDADDGFVTIRGAGLDLGFHAPTTYKLGRSGQRKLKQKTPRRGPWPLLISTLEPEDARAVTDPARHLFDRRFGAASWATFNRDWFTLVPVAPGGQYVDPQSGKLAHEHLTGQLMQFVRHYHVDFDRIVLDGKQEALVAASVQPYLFAGIVLRGGELTEDFARLVRNFAHVPIFVPIPTKDALLPRALKQAGHRNLTLGTPAELRRWLRRLRRRTPRAFAWRVQGPQHRFAHWINVDTVDWREAERTLEVEVDAKHNEIRMRANGVRRVTLFLNDDIIDLDRPVRVVTNDTLVHEKRLDRSLDVAFGRDPLNARQSMYFGLIFPARIHGLEVLHSTVVDMERR